MSYACNSQCSFCYNPFRKSPINYKTIDKLVKSIYDSHIPHVYLIGGEPSLLDTNKLNKYIDLLSKNSSVTIVTNGMVYKNGLSDKLACIGIAIHGNEKTHESLTGIKGSYQEIISTIKHYIKDGFDVRIIPVLMSANYNQIYSIIKLAAILGAESVFVDRFESGGIGSNESARLKPSLEQFREALSQMLKARSDFNIPVGFGTAIPFCLDKRLITENIWADCGVGVTFGAVSPLGDFRICNQSCIIYGNILHEPIEKIWNKSTMKDFRDLSWVREPCRSCALLYECTGGCKVDMNCSQGYCIDYGVRENTKFIVSPTELNELVKSSRKKEQIFQYPRQNRNFKINKYTRLNLWHKEKYLITRYQTITLDNLSIKIIQLIIDGITSEQRIIDHFKTSVSKSELRKFISKLLLANAIDLVKNSH